MAVPSRTISCEDDFPFSGSGRWETDVPRELLHRASGHAAYFRARWRDGQTRGANQFFTASWKRLKDARFPAGNTASVGHSEGDVCSDD